MNSRKTVFTVIIMLTIILIVTTISFAFFTYSRIGKRKITITTGNILFSYTEGDEATISSAFPVSDIVGARDISGEYSFSVTLSGYKDNVNYNVYLVSNNNDNSKNYFKNDQIKYALIKNNNYVADTDENNGKKLSELIGFESDSTNGEGLVLTSQNITKNQTDNYRLRIWISSDVDYSNTQVGNTSTGKYNDYKYSLKVKVISE